MAKKQKNSILRFILITLAGFFVGILLLSLLISLFLPDSSSFGNVALIKIRGPITVDDMDTFSSSTTSSTEIIKLINKADSNPSIEAIVFDINSPGGSAVASKEISDSIKRVNKTTVSLIHEIGTSGAYWIASSTDHIIANDLSITGSIGVISSYIEFEGLLNRYNMTYQRLVAGKYKDIGTPLKSLNKDEKDILQDKLDTIHAYFIKNVAENRGMTYDEARSVSTGEFYLGTEALDLNLVDQLGDMQTVNDYLQSNKSIGSIDLVEYETQKTFMDLFRSIFSDNSFYLMGKGIGSSVSDASKKTSSSITINT